ncbi:MAG: hypothetical protein GXP59_06980 [Deltaproteobacteria bacterium]|nr:hypothetical protein [Deltaproteobacteria bacterium]
MYRKHRKLIFLSVTVLALAFLIWRLVRPLNIFVVTDNFARPMAVTRVPTGLDSLRAADCGECHKAIYKEWAASMHAHAWTDPYFQADRHFDGSQQICLNCHIPLQNQQPHLVEGFLDRERLKPVLRKNVNFDPALQQEGVTCAVCHVRNGVINSPYVSGRAPHPSREDKSINEGMGICKKCHVVSGKRWDTFFRIPPCGTVAEIRAGSSGKGIHCIGCHMPLITRPLVQGGEPEPVHRHLWRGGHDPQMVRQAVKFNLGINMKGGGAGAARLTLTNTGTDHYLPTGTPDRYLSVTFTLQRRGVTVKKKIFQLKRTIMWRPFIVDLWDTRLIKGKPQSYKFSWSGGSGPGVITVTVRYHLLAETRRRRIKYRNKKPLSYIIFQRRTAIGAGSRQNHP